MSRSRKIVSSRELDHLRRLLTERSEELERANERLFLASQVKSEFLSHMSREFQRPLDHIVDFAACMRDGAMGEVNREQRICLETIIARGRRLQRMLARVLELSRSELGMAVFLPREFDVREPLDRAVARLQAEAERRRVVLEVTAFDDVCTLTADEGKFSFIVEELVANAVKFSDQGGRVTVDLREEAGVAGAGSWIEVRVADEGRGIREEELEQIFSSFEVGGGTAAGPGSLGLGLALVKRFVELHGGKIKVESRAGVGSTFTVTLPKGGAPPRLARVPRVLVADPDPEIRRLLTAGLREAGCESVALSDGRDALDKGLTIAPDLCILGVELAGGGIEVCRRLKSHEQGKDIPVIVTAPAPDRAARQRSIRSGADGFFVVPAEAAELILKARTLAAQKVNVDFLRRSYEIAASEAFTDPLTGLFNLRQFWLSLDHELARSRRYRRRCSLAMVDIDHFKLFNDRHGHLRGDEVLREAAAVFRGSIRTSDIAARYGGEEFVVIMPETDRELALLAGEKLRRAVAEHPFPLRETQPGGLLTVSIGIATFPEDADSPRELVDAADKALYRAKEGGRNRVAVFAS